MSALCNRCGHEFAARIPLSVQCPSCSEDVAVPFNLLSPEAAERLALLIEELGEALHMAGKVLRHGYESVHPDDLRGPTNKQALERELGDVRAAMILLCANHDLSKTAIHDRAEVKLSRVGQWMHYAHMGVRRTT